MSCPASRVCSQRRSAVLSRPNKRAEFTARNRRIIAVRQPGGVELRFPLLPGCRRPARTSRARPDGCARSCRSVAASACLRQHGRDICPGAHIDPFTGDVPEQPFPACQHPPQMASAAVDPLRLRTSRRRLALDPAAAVMLAHVLANHHPNAQLWRTVQRHAQPPQLWVDAKMGRLERLGGLLRLRSAVVGQ